MLRDPFSVLVVIKRNDGKILVIQRKDDADFWQSVTGGIEPNESPIECAYREVYEETGINCKQLKLVIKDLGLQFKYEIREQWLYRYKQGCKLNTENVFALRVPNSQKIKLCPEEHTDYKWLKPRLAKKKVWSQSNKVAINFVRNV